MREPMFLFAEIAVCMAFLVGIPTYTAGASVRTADLSEGNFDMPDGIAEVTDAKELEGFLRDPNVLNRMAAVRRLGQIEGSEAVPELVGRFKAERYGGTLVFRVYVKLEIIRTLEHIGGRQAEAALLNIARTYLENGPQVQLAEMEYPMGTLTWTIRMFFETRSTPCTSGETIPTFWL